MNEILLFLSVSCLTLINVRITIGNKHYSNFSIRVIVFKNPWYHQSALLIMTTCIAFLSSGNWKGTIIGKKFNCSIDEFIFLTRENIYTYSCNNASELKIDLECLPKFDGVGLKGEVAHKSRNAEKHNFD